MTGNLFILTEGFAAITALAAPSSPLAYLGPGGVVSSLGAILAIIAGVIVALFGFLWYPLKRLLRALRRKRSGDEPGDAA